MLLLILLAIMTGAAVLSALWPLSRRSVEVEPDSDVPFYKAQLSEIDRDRDRGILDPQSAEAARIESGRRLLKAAAQVPSFADTTSEPALRRRRAASALALCVVPIVGLAVYGDLGSPQLLGRSTSPRPEARAADGMAVALAKVEEHLAAHPDDVRGWDIIAPIYLRGGRLDDAARAFRRARSIGGETPERLLGEAEALVGQNGGIIEAEAAGLFRRVIQIDPGVPAGRYYVALTAEQGGDTAKAVADYRSLLEASPPDAPWVALVGARLARLEGRSPPSIPSVLPAGSVSPEIAGMVAGLDDRLKTSGGSLDEWSRLLRSLVVLGRRDDALDRLTKAKAVFATDRTATGTLDDVARDLGLRAEIAKR